MKPGTLLMHRLAAAGILGRDLQAVVTQVVDVRSLKDIPYRLPVESSNKFVPHVGAKQRAKLAKGK